MKQTNAPLLEPDTAGELSAPSHADFAENVVTAAKVRRRLDVLAIVAAYRREGIPFGGVLRAMGVSRPTLWRWERAVKLGGVKALSPKPPHQPRSRLALLGATAGQVEQAACAWQCGFDPIDAWGLVARRSDCPLKLKEYILNAPPLATRFIRALKSNGDWRFGTWKHKQTLRGREHSLVRLWMKERRRHIFP